jgi:hypothetical protein
MIDAVGYGPVVRVERGVAGAKRVEASTPPAERLGGVDRHAALSWWRAQGAQRLVQLDEAVELGVVLGGGDSGTTGDTDNEEGERAQAASRAEREG